MESNLFIAHTPYHLTLDIAIIREEKLNNNVLVVFDTFNITNEQIIILKKYFNEINIIKNKCIDSFSNKFSIKEWINKYKYINDDVKIFDIILEKLSKKNFKKVFFSNNTYIEVQIMINRIRKNFSEIYYVEDGCAAYHDIIYKEKFFQIKKLLKPRYLLFSVKYNFFKNFKISSAIGIGDEVLGGYYFNKKYIRDELKNRTSKNISIECYKKTIEEFYPIKEKINNSIIVIMDYSKSGHCDKVISIIKLLNELEEKIYIKYHPREYNFYADFLLNKNIIKLDSNFNVESILVNTSNNVIIGSGGSTTFITSPLISNNVYLITNKLFNLNNNNRLINIEKQLGVIEINDFIEIEKIIKQIRRDRYVK